jgi:hypothetical protein
MSIYDKAGVALIPSGTKASKLYSVLPANGNGDFTHSRGSTATRVNIDGLIESVSTNVPRLDYPLIDGVVQDCPALLLEPSRTNYLERTEEFSNSYWTKYNSSVSANQVVSPDGAVTADKLIENTVNTQHEIGRAFGFTSGQTYVVSVFAKSSERNLQIRGGNTNTFPANANFDLSNGTIQSTSLGTAYIEDYGNGWYRCMVKATAAASSTTNVNFRLVNGTLSTYTGDNSSGVFLWGAQNEIGLYPTSYIPWDGSGSTTRSLDACGSAGTSSDFNSAEGVLFAEMANLSNDGVEKRLGLQDSGTYETVRITYVPTANRITAVVYNGANQCVFHYDVPDTTDFNKIALKYKVNDFALWVNGFEVGTDTVGSTFDANQLDELAFDVNNGARVYAKTKQLMTFKTALNDSELETLVSWDSFNAMATGQLYTIE